MPDVAAAVHQVREYRTGADGVDGRFVCRVHIMIRQ